MTGMTFRKVQKLLHLRIDEIVHPAAFPVERVIAEHERKLVTDTFNRTEADLETDHTLHSLIMEQAGGAGSTGHGRILDFKPKTIHQRYVIV